jgi:hypothetical protein
VSKFGHSLITFGGWTRGFKQVKNGRGTPPTKTANSIRQKPGSEASGSIPRTHLKLLKHVLADFFVRTDEIQNLHLTTKIQLTEY